jgi:mono/diheme cytochrome c family protein
LPCFSPSSLLCWLRRLFGSLARAGLLVGACLLTAQAIAQKSPSAVERGRYLVKTTGCNDCHTAGYAQAAGKIAEKDWLQGDALGWQGPWGTTYATNLRLHFSRLSEAQWLQQARTMQTRPPMPWFVLREMHDADLKAIYAYLRAAGPAGQPAPAALPPGQAAKGPVVQFPGAPQ